MGPANIRVEKGEGRFEGVSWVSGVITKVAEVTASLEYVAFEELLKIQVEDIASMFRYMLLRRGYGWTEDRVVSHW